MELQDNLGWKRPKEVTVHLISGASQMAVSISVSSIKNSKAQLTVLCELCILYISIWPSINLHREPLAHPVFLQTSHTGRSAKQGGIKPVCWEGAKTAWTGTCRGPGKWLLSQLCSGYMTLASCVSLPHHSSSHLNTGLSKALSLLENYWRIRPYYGNAGAKERRVKHYKGFFSLSQLNECFPNPSCPALVCAVTVVSKNSVWFFKQFLTKQALSEKS